MLVEEYGLSPVDPHQMRAAQATFLAFLVAGMVPLLPWLIAAPNAFQRLRQGERRRDRSVTMRQC